MPLQKHPSHACADTHTSGGASTRRSCNSIRNTHPTTPVHVCIHVDCSAKRRLCMQTACLHTRMFTHWLNGKVLNWAAHCSSGAAPAAPVAGFSSREIMVHKFLCAARSQLFRTRWHTAVIKKKCIARRPSYFRELHVCPPPDGRL